MIADEVECSALFLAENHHYEEALKLLGPYEDNLNPQLVIAAATCYLNTQNPIRGLELLNNAEEKGWLLPEILILKGRCLYSLGEYSTALNSFLEADKIRSDVPTTQWIQRCEAHLECEHNPNSPNIIVYTPTILEKPRHDWYQTAQNVTLSVYIQGLSEQQVKVEFTEKTVTISIQREQKITLSFHLAKSIVPTESSFTITPFKMEVKMRKEIAIQWSSYFIAD